jgi:aspartate/glutamate racemase
LEAVEKEARILVGLGCSKIVMPCITAHALLDSGLSQFPFIDVREVVAARIAVSFPEETVGILATRGARLSRAVEKFLPRTQHGLFLDERDEEAFMSFIYAQAKTWKGGRDVSPLRGLANKMRQRGCGVIIAGCTEAEMCFARYAPEETSLVLPLRTVAQFYATTWSRKQE